MKNVARCAGLRWNSAAAFTLLELLIVIAIMMVLAGLLLPALARVKAKARSVDCLSNLKQWGVATHLYVGDHDDFLPRDGTPNGTSTKEGWYIDLPKAMGVPAYSSMAWRTNAAIDPGHSIWICPANKRRSNGFNLFHYCLNRHVNDASTTGQVRLSSLRRIDNLVWLFDNGKLAAVAQQNNVHTNLHSGGAQFLFLDGHVALFPRSVYWDNQRHQGVTSCPELRWIP